MLLLSTLFTVALATLALSQNLLNKSTLTSIRREIRNVINEDPGDRRLIGGLVRLVFHDCVGRRCDGCINMKLEGNSGLRIYITLMEPLYRLLLSKGVRLSRADYWYISATEAIFYALDNAKVPISNSTFKFNIGREDCSTSPQTTEIAELPFANWGAQEILSYFNRTLGFDAKETTAIIGAHALGEAHEPVSGFTHSWVANKQRLNNEFYRQLLRSDNGWNQIKVGSQSSPKHQWVSKKGQLPTIMMLNSDISLIKDLGNLTADGLSSCTYGMCKNTTMATHRWVNAFSANNSLFITEFFNAYQKMTSHGYKNLVVIPT